MFKEYPVIEHILIVGLPGSFKDVTAVKMCHDGFLKGKHIFSNQKLGFDHVFLRSHRDMRGISGDVWNPGIFYIHDMGEVFNAREWMQVNSKTDVRKLAVNRYRKRGIQIIGTCHRENEVDIDIRVGSIRWFVYPKVYRMNDNMEDHIVKLRWFDKPEMYDKGKKPKAVTAYSRPDKWAKLYNTLEENPLGLRPFKGRKGNPDSASQAERGGFGGAADAPQLILD